MATPVKEILTRKTKKIEYDGSGNAIYVGEAEPNTLMTEAKWSIKKITYDANGNVTDIKWANGSNEYKFVWNDRASYTYS